MELSQINEKIRQASGFIEDIRQAMNSVIVGQAYLMDRLLIGLLANGHILIEGVPGLAKTLAVKTLSDTIQTQFQRIQFTPDLLPADILGTLIFDQKSKEFIPKKGPIFANLILADEINRAPAKVQSALLEAMQERQVTIGDSTYALDKPFMVLATQNPIDQEGTYPLPEAQIDRFMLKLIVGYPNEQEELAIIRRHGKSDPAPPEKCASPEKIRNARELLKEVYVDEKIEEYIVRLVLASRDPGRYGLPRLKPYIQYGASPRASLYCLRASRAHAFLNRRGYVAPEDVQAVAMDILRHRIILTYEAEAEELTSEVVIRQLLDKIEVP